MPCITKMNHDNKNTNSQNDLEKQSLDFFGKAEIPFEKSKDEVWQHLSGKIGDKEETKKRHLSTERIVFSIAAGLMLLLSIGSIMRFYTKTVRVEAGHQLSYQLPDGSQVELNAQTVLRYNPLWWSISRDVSLEGEAFFEVTKGISFIVNSQKGNAKVLGTSFNIYSRPDIYKVTCLTGKVMVTSKAEEEVILTPNYEATISANGNVIVRKNTKPEQIVSWKNGMFNFTAVPLQLVINEIERQYNVRILISDADELTYTGFFSRNNSVEDVLKVVCKPFNLNYEKKKENVYEIFK